MAEGQPILGIDAQTVRATLAKSGILIGENYEKFANRMQLIMRDEQPELYSFLATVGQNPDTVPNRSAFVLAMAHSYDMLSEEVTSVPLTRDDMLAVVRSFEENRTSEMRNGVPTVVSNPLPWIGEIADDSPAFFSWLRQMSERFSTPDAEKSFIEGGIFTVMPFLMRGQAQHAE